MNVKQNYIKIDDKVIPDKSSDHRNHRMRPKQLT